MTESALRFDVEPLGYVLHKLKYETRSKSLYISAENQSANPGGWNGVPRLRWGFALHHYSSSKAVLGDEWNGEYADVPVSSDNPSRHLSWEGQTILEAGFGLEPTSSFVIHGSPR